MRDVAIALNRFGLGARGDEPAPSHAKPWLLAQLDAYQPRPSAWQSAPHTPELLEAWLTQQRAVRLAPEGQRSGIREAYLRQSREAYVASVGARTASALQSTTPVVERLVHFWSNHFAVSVDKLTTVGMAGSFEADAIRPNVLGRFEDLLVAALRHPAMLLYLDQAQSIGPSSPAGLRAAARQPRPRPRGLNENLAREILELHTLGVRSGYTQDDVTELARALTGWTLPSDDATPAGAGADASPSAPTFRFVPALHEPGARTVLGQRHAEGGESQALAILHHLATSPATARHVATKLARHFVADDPPPALVQRLSDTFLRSGGNLPSLYRELFEAPEAWAPASLKFKSPWEWSISSLRALGRREVPANQVVNMLGQLGQPVWRPGSPAGWGDVTTTWAAPDALLRRVEMAQRLASAPTGRAASSTSSASSANAASTPDARALAPLVLPAGSLTPATAQAIAQAESANTALALLLVSPEFLRR